MNTIAIVVISCTIIVVIYLISVKTGVVTINGNENKSKYHYFAKKYMMTKRERDFFVRLNKVFGEKCYIVPQPSLSLLVSPKGDHKRSYAAWQHINRKSVDYCLISRKDFSTFLAIELDDITHDRNDRVARDKEVERILNEADVPLVRFRNINNLTDTDIRKKAEEAYKKIETVKT